MAEGADKQDKSFDASPQRLQKAREEGNVFRSTEIISVGMLIVGVAGLFYGMPYGFDGLKRIMIDGLSSAGTTPLSAPVLPRLLTGLALQVGLILLPFFLLLLVGGFAFNVVQTGWNVTTTPLMPKLNRISPAQGFKRIFSGKSLFELFKAIVKLAAVGPLVYLAGKDHIAEIIQLPALPLDEIFRTAGGWIFALLAKMLGVLVLLTGIDFGYQRWRYKSDLKMTLEEVKEESKQQEVDPQVKGKRRQMAARMSRRPRLDHAVLKADVVITNPTHFAVALRYDPEEGGAPRVLVKGRDKRALRIRELARNNQVPVVENPPLARALYKAVAEEQEIPPDLYAAVAAVLAEIFRKRSQEG